ncbi:(E2-independent) E3 ubiquitin-conjugating enzyme FATS [Cottoperca gobio]|uniref:(E2-independent) E3 ubiquitin-conjugating enzyme FATS n=1 Tax=Cottoperca gobio TaxID=56716 RepID=A0A6J2R7B3_COTGO|nr:(E2-independent) E3 ubiquitin-conjugating enzyme FATS-like [Cottoperca gobio]
MRSGLQSLEALELFRPDFISRSQGRVMRLEQKARKRRSLQDSNPDLMQGLGEDRGRQKRNCTTPNPLSDNLFKPRERSISGREMQLRSRRIYNKLPEVTKKKEEEKKRTVSQTNRLRADLFKKRLLDQILQR